MSGLLLMVAEREKAFRDAACALWMRAAELDRKARLCMQVALEVRLCTNAGVAWKEKYAALKTERLAVLEQSQELEERWHGPCVRRIA